jgi:hypothetical protein
VSWESSPRGPEPKKTLVTGEIGVEHMAAIRVHGVVVRKCHELRSTPLRDFPDLLRADIPQGSRQLAALQDGPTVA